nr:hypothetical protein [uncultured Blautia sp.]
MKKGNKRLHPIIITKNCIKAVITFDCVAVLRSDYSLWLLHPFTSRMCQKLRERQRDGKHPYWDEAELGSKPKFQKLMKNVSTISASAMTMAIVQMDGSLWVWDRMQHGYENEPHFYKLANRIKTAEAGEGVLLAISQDGTLLYWEKKGYDSYCSQKPRHILENVVQISVGVGHYAAIQSDGSLWMWGKNDCGQLGNGTCNDKEKPKRIMDHVIQVSLGARHSAVIDEKHQLWMWGNNEQGQLGTVLPGNRSKPVMVMKNVQKVSLGYSHTGVIDIKQQMWMCGFNGKYEVLGNGDIQNHRGFIKNTSYITDLKLHGDRTVVFVKNKLIGWN